MNSRFLIIIAGILVLSLFIVADNSETRYAYAGCVATILPQPCFDSFSGSHLPLTERGIMEDYARHIELNFGEWQMSDRKWDDENTPLQLPAIICTEFVADGVKHYRMAKWVDAFKISSFEDHRNDFLCNKWLAPIDDGVKVKWDKPNYFSNDNGIIQVTDKDMNLDNNKIDSFVIHVWSDTDHNGIQLTVAETDESSGIFESKVFFTVMGESSGTTLLVEDAVWAEHKSNVNFSKIIESETEPTIDAFDRKDKLPGYFIIVAYWPAVVVTVGIIVTVVFIWRKKKMKTDSRIIISIDKQFYSEEDEIIIHVWFNHKFYTYATLTILSPAGITVDSVGLKTDTKTTETFAFTCGGSLMFENGYYTIKVECDNVVSEAMFEYYNPKNRFKRGLLEK